MTRPCLTIPLMPLGIGSTWAAGFALLLIGSIDHDHDGWILAVWGLAVTAVALTLSISYLISAQCDLIRRSFELGRATAQPGEPVPVPIRR